MWLDKPSKPRNIIVDVDGGSDDAWALFMLFRAMNAGLCEIKAITCVNGNTDIENVIKNVFRVLQTVGKEHSIPVYKGASLPLMGYVESDHYHGMNGFCDIEFEDPVDITPLQSKHAVNAIADIVSDHPMDIELVLLGPLTNIALAIRMYGSKIVDNVKSLWIMGGNNSAVGNITKSAEFNFYLDPEAVEIVLSSFTCPINIVPWETCLDGKLKVPLKWRMDELGAINNPITKLLNALDQKFYVARNREYFKPCDGLLTAIFLSKDAVEVDGHWHASIELHGRHTRGQLVLDHLKTNQANVRIVEKLDMEVFKKILMWTVGHDGHVCIRQVNK